MKKIILLTALFIYYATLSYAQHAGDLDSSFGTNGIFTANLGSSYNYNFSVKKVLAQSDGSIYLIVIVSYNHVMIIKTHPNGSTDSSYGHRGFSIADNIYANDALLQPDGKIVVVGGAGGNFAVIRFNTDGSSDKTFGENGRQITYFKSKYSKVDGSEAYAAVLQDDGKIVAIGRIRLDPFAPFEFAAIARYNTDGSLDNSFSEDGEDIYPTIVDGGEGFLYSVALQHDGKIVVLGGKNSFALQRINIDGSSDKTFSEDGFQEIDFETTAPAMAIQSDDKIVLGSNALARYNTDGSPDNTFDNDGKQTTDFQISSLSIQSDGKILTAGGALARYNPDGSFDNSFSDDGKQANDFEISSLALQHDGKIVVAGSSAVRYNINGELDNSFIINGQLLHPVNQGNTEYNGIKFEQSGKFLVRGHRWNGNSFENILVRYTTNDSLDSTFSEDGIQVVNADIKSVGIQNNGILLLVGDSILSLNSDGSRNNTFNGNGILYPDFRVSSMAIQNDGKIVVAGTSQVDYYGYPVSAFTVARYNTNGSIDDSFSGDGKQTTFDEEESGAAMVAIQDDGKIVAAGYAGAEPSGVMARYNTDGNLDTTFYGSGAIGIGFEIGIRSMAVGNNGDIAIIGIEGYRSDVQILLKSYGTNKFTKDLSTFPFGWLLAFQNDGKLIMGGSLLIRFTSNGNLDSSFSGNGLQTPEGNLSGIAVFDNKLYTAGSGQYPGTQGVVARYLLNSDSQTSPIVKITSPVDSVTYTALATVLLSADATDKGGTIKTVDFYNGDKLIFSEKQAPFYRKWYNVPVGNYSITAKATDNDGNVSTSGVVHVSVVPNKVPTVKITSPINGGSYTALATVLLSANAYDPDGKVEAVDFYNGSTLIFREQAAPFHRQWYNVPAGDYTITAKATDNNGKSTTSAPVHITVLGPDFLTANITSPGNGASFTAPATFTLTADVKGPNEIVKTDFYNGSTLIFTEHLFPYSNKWRNVPAGNYSVTAKATDSKGNVATSVPVAIKVKSSASATLVSDKPVSLNSKTNLRDVVSVQLMPNPANNILNIRTTGLQRNKTLIVSVISVSGIIIQTKKFSSSTQTIQLNVSSLVSGVYAMKLACEDKILYKQFLKLK